MNGSDPDRRVHGIGDPAPAGRVDADGVTWAVLLARWVDFAKSAAALPKTGHAGRLRDSAADLITLQAVWFALQHLDELDHDERSLGLDRAAVLIDRHAAALGRRWSGDPLPDGCRELIDDARAALAAARRDGAG